MQLKEFFKNIFKSGAKPLTEGNIPIQLTQFAIPFMAANFLQALYGAADMIIVGQFTDAAGLSAVAIGSQFVFMINSVVIGLAIGGSIIIGQLYGAGEYEEIKGTIGTMLTLFGIMSLAIMLILPLFMDGIVTLLGTPQAAFSAAKGYITINMIGISTMFAYNALAAIFRGFGDSTSPLIFVGVACAANIVGDLLLVGFFKMGAQGAALATVLAQGLSAVLSVIYAKRADYKFDFKLSSMRIERGKLKRLMRIGLPMGVQFSLTSISFMFIMATVSRMGGVVASAAVGITSKVNGFTMLPPMSFCGAISGMVAQNIGARKPGRARLTMLWGTAISVCFGIATFILLFFFPHPVIRIFTPDSTLIDATSRYLRSFSIDCVLVCLFFCMNGFFNGCGKTSYTMLNNAVSAFMVRVPATWILSSVHGASLFTIGFAAPIATAEAILCHILYFKSGRWRNKKGVI
ncbi:MAG: MATE family efflux transporter [Synergistes sp.]|nr:MATE family efflux transporter [Synergistes sp.]